jgi:hypothetical protein
LFLLRAGQSGISFLEDSVRLQTALRHAVNEKPAWRTLERQTYVPESDFRTTYAAVALDLQRLAANFCVARNPGIVRTP